MEHPKYGYEMMLPEAILRQTLETIEQLPKASGHGLRKLSRQRIERPPGR